MKTDSDKSGHGNFSDFCPLSCLEMKADTIRTRFLMEEMSAKKSGHFSRGEKCPHERIRTKSGHLTIIRGQNREKIRVRFMSARTKADKKRTKKADIGTTPLRGVGGAKRAGGFA